MDFIAGAAAFIAGFKAFIAEAAAFAFMAFSAGATTIVLARLNARTRAHAHAE